jgi:hypothetical protein
MGCTWNGDLDARISRGRRDSAAGSILQVAHRVRPTFEAVGVDRVVTVDVHNLRAFQNAYRCVDLGVSLYPVIFLPGRFDEVDLIPRESWGGHRPRPVTEDPSLFNYHRA